jgi:hypothetical protein
MLSLSVVVAEEEQMEVTEEAEANSEFSQTNP